MSLSSQTHSARDALADPRVWRSRGRCGRSPRSTRCCSSCSRSCSRCRCRRARSDWSVAVEYRDGRPAYVFLSPDDKWRLPVALDASIRSSSTALVALEDKRFWRHDGVDPIAIVRAACDRRDAHARRVSGGSTLTMQLARLLEPRPRTMPNKLRRHVPRGAARSRGCRKREILEQYLSRTPYGGNVEGIESAAWSYFGHGARPPDAARDRDAARGAAGPDALRAAGPATRRGCARAATRSSRKLIAAGVFPATDAAVAARRGRRLAAARAAAPDAARGRRTPRSWLRGAPPRRDRASARRSTPARRRSPSARSRCARPSCTSKGIHGGAVVVVDHRTREVVALVGNLDFGDATHGGQIAMFARPRSPGSTLKPFLYALAIDRGLALPELPRRRRADAVRHLPAAQLRRRLRRPRHAARRARPIAEPAVRRAARSSYGVERFLGELGRMGISLGRLAPGEYGLSLIAGGIEAHAARARRAVRDARRRRHLPAAPPRGGGRGRWGGRRRGQRFRRRLDLRPGRRVADARCARQEGPAGLPAPARARRRAGRDPLEDRHQLRPARCVGDRLGPALHGRRVDRQPRQLVERGARRLGSRRPAAVRRPRRPRGSLAPAGAAAAAARAGLRRCLRVLRLCRLGGLPGAREGARAGPRGPDGAGPVLPGLRRRSHHRPRRAPRVPRPGPRLRSPRVRRAPELGLRVARRAQPGDPRSARSSPTAARPTPTPPRRACSPPPRARS